MFGKKEKEQASKLLCHYDKKPCIKERCMKWQTGPVEKVVDNVKQSVLHSDCADVWQLLYLKAIAQRTDGTQVAVESVREEARKNVVALASVISRQDFVGVDTIRALPPLDRGSR